KNIEIPLPPLSEQKRIAGILDAADRLRQQDKALIGCYNQLAQSVFLEMFGDPVRNERGWEMKELGNVSGKITDGAPKSTNCRIRKESHHGEGCLG
ncbi:MAG: restriction endonuclease subunit S, partial [Bacteroidetes bacterium]|nr:restriction endonuclease subunit S [Bacteroidota bacterium]